MSSALVHRSPANAASIGPSDHEGVRGSVAAGLLLQGVRVARSELERLITGVFLRPLSYLHVVLRTNSLGLYGFDYSIRILFSKRRNPRKHRQRPRSLGPKDASL